MRRDELSARLSVVRDPEMTRRRGDNDLNPDMGVARKLVPAAVLVPIVARRPYPTVLFTERSGHLRDHAGQISFPGGRVELADTSHEATALREAEEEIGLSSERVELLGRLDTYRTRTGFEITPVVGMVEPDFPMRIDQFEVADVFEVPLAFVLDPRNHQRHSRALEGRQRHFFVLPYEERYIWGATAGMLVNLYDVLTGG